ncbi:hypothetical protein Tco_0468029 [Tanacetum coccineum]
MADSLSPDNVFNFLVDDPVLDLEDDPELDVEEDPEEEQDMDIEEDVPPVVASPAGSPPISPPPLLESSSDSDTTAAATTDRTLWVRPAGSTFEIGGPSSVTPTLPHLLAQEVGSLRRDVDTLHGSVRTLVRGMETRQTEIFTTCNGVDRICRRIDAFDVDIAFVEQATARVDDDVTALQARAKTVEARLLQVEQEKIRDMEEIERLKTRVESDEISAALASIDRDQIERG